MDLQVSLSQAVRSPGLPMTAVSKNAKEFSRLNSLMDLEAAWITVRDACALNQLKRRQVFRS